MTYSEAIDFLFDSHPAFERQGADGYKPGLECVERLAEAFGNPHKHLRCIHIAGTNGKGSTAHLLAAILQNAGYRTGLFTSPHLVDFTERIRMDGVPVCHDEVVRFVERYQAKYSGIQPSFFELSTIMAFDIFRRNGADISVIETGLGGRLDSTNIIDPMLSVITNVDYDHTDLLGDTLEAIATEKAGIIKPGRPVIVSEAPVPEVRRVFADRAARLGCEITFAEDVAEIQSSIPAEGEYRTATFGALHSALTGECQLANARGVLEAVKALRKAGLTISDDAVARGFAEVTLLTGLRGRWSEGRLPQGGRLVYDTGHNPAGWRYTVARLGRLGGQLHMVIGFVVDKDVRSILRLMARSLPAGTQYYFTQPDSHRALEATRLKAMAAEEGITGTDFGKDVDAAVAKAEEGIASGDTLFIGGSNYLIGQWLSSRSPRAHL